MNDYSPKEEKLNVISHGFGFFLSIVALIVLVIKATEFGNVWHIVSVAIYGVSMIIMYAASSLYHNAKQPDQRKKLKIFDHAAIYVLIAGTYAPFTLITLKETVGWYVFGVIWGMALIGITLKLFFTGKYKILSTLMYILMSWVIIFAIKPLIDNLSYDGLFWLFAGGVFYMVGAVLYSIKKIKFNHAIFHVCVLAGSFCHFYSIYYYVLPGK
ncbi:hemolysin III family protein [Brumimicrobium glaciale]|uniref:Hemolysin III family protein n=1 Tax=Brumimicrobium glaciale TaxID=200475 RepID=A0A4Q4KFM7_9FLAO|nr:hemolysin III family protein [Brumimicrobium glaciale]RYM31327.1 hemolysin III family protein [Brumimicrobium glaciale]